MQWINDHRYEWGVILLFLLIISLMGTWFYDLINVPAQYDCSPNIRLEGDFCGSPVPGIWGILAIIGVVVGVFGGRLSLDDLRAMLYFVLILLPFISSWLWFARKKHPRQWIFHLATWGLAAIFIWFPYNLIVLTADLQFHPARLWGLWLYTALVTIVFFIEIVQSINRKRYNPERSLSGSQTEEPPELEAPQP